jgi:hypothetical protein
MYVERTADGMLNRQVVLINKYYYVTTLYVIPGTKIILLLTYKSFGLLNGDVL